MNAEDHIENIYRFCEGRGTSFYECLRTYGLEWFGSRSFFEGRRQANQALWIDLALALRSGQELRNHYDITKSPEYAPLRRFFSTAVDDLQLRYNASLVTSAKPQSLIVTMRAEVKVCNNMWSEGSLMLLSPPHDVPEATLPAAGIKLTEPTTRDAVSPVVLTRRITPANRPLQYLEAGQLGASDPQHVLSKPSVPDLCIASSNLLSVIDPLTLDRLSQHTVSDRRLIATTYWLSPTATSASPVKTWRSCSSTWTTMLPMSTAVPRLTTTISHLCRRRRSPVLGGGGGYGQP